MGVDKFYLERLCDPLTKHINPLFPQKIKNQSFKGQTTNVSPIRIYLDDIYFFILPLRPWYIVSDIQDEILPSLPPQVISY